MSLWHVLYPVDWQTLVPSEQQRLCNMYRNHIELCNLGLEQGPRLYLLAEDPRARKKKTSTKKTTCKKTTCMKTKHLPMRAARLATECRVATRHPHWAHAFKFQYVHLNVQSSDQQSS